MYLTLLKVDQVLYNSFGLVLRQYKPSIRSGGEIRSIEAVQVENGVTLVLTNSGICNCNKNGTSD